MIQVLNITMKDLRVVARDRTGLMMLLAMPLILIAVLGAVFGNAFAQSPKIEPFAVAVVDHDHGALADLLWQVMDGPELQDLVTISKLEETEAEDLIRKGKLVGAIVVPADFTVLATSGQAAELHVLRDPGQEFRVSIVQAIAQAFTDHLTAAQLAIAEVAAGGEVPDPAALGEQVARQVAEAQVRTEKEVVVPGAKIGSFQYYAFGMACMFLLMSGSVGLQSIAAEERNQTLARTIAGPVSRASFLMGKAGGQIAVAFAQFVILFLGTSMIYHVNWGNPCGVMVVGFAYSFAVGGLSMLVASVVKSSAAAITAWMIGVQLCAALGGSMVPLSQFPNFMQKVAMLSPNFWGLKSFLSLAMGQPIPWAYVMPLFMVGTIAVSVGVTRLAGTRGV